ncbi:Annexin A7 [Phytophthora nicotianae]|uniref:Annexin A7 n=1 Tax=Phytophthora nicotianae TaxID=4792 RepID=A0A0W8CQM5_PHYNI|nr:Annexin A7 [Phytophthora nicotianae]
MSSAGGKKRPRADLLSSLDAVFASTAQPAVSKYTAQATAQSAPKGSKQQAYQHSKRKRKDKKRDKGGNGRGDDKETDKQSGEKDVEEKKEVKVDPMYEKMDTELLAVGLKNCSLVSHSSCELFGAILTFLLQQPQVKTLTKPRALHETLKNYLESVTQGTRAGSNAVDSLKNKVLSLDNPFKTSATETAEKTIAAASRSQTAKLLSARQRRKLGLHMLGGEMKYSDAEQLNDIWTRYVSQVIESELSEVQSVTEEVQRTRNSKLQAKLKYLDLSGCRIEGGSVDQASAGVDDTNFFAILPVSCAVIQSQNPLNVGIHGIIVAESMQTVQICRPATSNSDSTNSSICCTCSHTTCFRVIFLTVK